MARQNRYETVAKIVNISTTRNDLSSDNSYSKKAFVEFTDYEGKPAKGFFTIGSSLQYNTLSVGSEVEIEYFESKFLGSYTVFLLNPELYKRIPTEEELAFRKRNNKTVLQQSLMGVGALFLSLILYGITKNILVIAALVVATYFIIKHEPKQE